MPSIHSDRHRHRRAFCFSLLLSLLVVKQTDLRAVAVKELKRRRRNNLILTFDFFHSLIYCLLCLASKVWLFFYYTTGKTHSSCFLFIWVLSHVFVNGFFFHALVNGFLMSAFSLIENLLTCSCSMLSIFPVFYQTWPQFHGMYVISVVVVFSLLCNANRDGEESVVRYSKEEETHQEKQEKIPRESCGLSEIWLLHVWLFDFSPTNWSSSSKDQLFFYYYR